MRGKDMPKKMSLKEQAKEIIRIAQESGVRSNYFFVTTFNRYQVQLGILDGLEDAIKAEGTLVEKEYVKSRKNLYSNPAISEYNRTADSANKTVSTLMKIIREFGNDDADGEGGDDLLRYINGEADE